MADDPNAAINDALRQSAHAAEIKARRQPPESDASRMDAQIDARAEAAAQKALAGLTIQSGNCMRFSGSGRNITGAWEPPTAPNANDPVEETTGLPEGAAGDILYHDGTEWVVLAAPSAPGDPDDDPVLRHNGTAPYWDTPEECA